MERLSVPLRRAIAGRRLRLRACGLFAALVALACQSAFADAQPCAPRIWPLWEAWASRYVQDDGRMLSSSMQADHSTSEGQSYGMFFALVADDPLRFERLWRWTEANMAGADPARLPGWLWGRGKDGQWRLQDANSATDADLWMAYALLEAARLWRRPDYRDDALRLMKIVEATLVVELPGLGKMVLPGPEGYVQPGQLWHLNPSYLPLPLLRRLAKAEPDGPWREIAANTVAMIRRASPKGYVADWVGYQGTASATGAPSGKFVRDPVTGALGSYDAIRVYLWAGVTPKADPAAAPLLAALHGMATGTAADGSPPEKVQVDTGATEGQAPFGYAAALVPYFIARGEPRLAAAQQRRMQQGLDAAFAGGNQRPELLYYNVMLSLFASGWTDKRYRFRRDGTLELSWETSCVRAVPR